MLADAVAGGPTGAITRRRALKRPDAEEFEAAMDSEIKNCHQRGVWDYCPRAEARENGKTPKPCKWFLVVKTKDTGDGTSTMDKYKARVVYRGDLQQYGEDFDATWPGPL